MGAKVELQLTEEQLRLLIAYPEKEVRLTGFDHHTMNIYILQAPEPKVIQIDLELYPK